MDQNLSARRDELVATWVDIAIRLAILAFLLYWSYLLVRPFITIMVWSIVLAVALYPLYEMMVSWLGGRRRLAAALLTLLNLLIVIGPATWLALSLIDGLRTLSDKLDFSAFVLPPPPIMIKSWPFLGETLYQYWELASTNLDAALAKVAPELKPVGSFLLQIAAGAGVGTVKFLAAVVVAGFLFSPAPMLVDELRLLLRRIASGRGEQFVRLAGDTIRAVSRGVVGISALQAFFAALGLYAIGIPVAGLLTTIILVFGIIQIGPTVVIIPLVIWSWISTDTTTALVFTAYMIPVSLLDNILRPLVLGRGLDAPILIILLGVIGGTISQGITGLFLGPIVLAVIWNLLMAWISDQDDAKPISP
jgi:predicted PurR-regulated permease PerM